MAPGDKAEANVCWKLGVLQDKVGVQWAADGGLKTLSFHCQFDTS